MIEELKKCRFKYTFRDYQQRVLTAMKSHLKDKKINVVAAPGAGKTILALSLMIEIGEPTLIVAPTILLKQQWLDRLKNDFFGYEEIKSFISEDIYSPNLITVTTYQSIYSIYKGKSEKSQNIDIVNLLKQLNIKTIILDEAHHLKMAWLDATKNVIEKLTDTVTISLTATPPYDIESNLWNKYISLCGDIDAEISVPELVKTKDLAPHQDYVFFNYPSDKEIEEINEYSQNVYKFFEKYSTSQELITAISMHEGIVDINNKLEYFIDNFQYYNAMISFLHFNKISIPEMKWVSGNNIKIFNYKYKDIEFNIYKMQILLTYCLYNDKKSYNSFATLFRKIARELNQIGAIYEKKVNLVYSNNIIKHITQNVGKMNSVKEILEIEKWNLKDKLKAVVITENIYKELLSELEQYDTKFMGVIPLFRYLSSKTELKYVVLTGEIIIIPTKYNEQLINIAENIGINKENININEFSLDFNYSKVSFEGNAIKSRVLVITRLFEESDIDVLIGSNALIGEGWDAPFINTLIMATSISAYVTANQIRGRAIRKYKKDPNKVANIWHLVCVEKNIYSEFKYGLDYENLVNRFESFEGINIDGDKIAYGISRLNLPYDGGEYIKNLTDINRNFIRYSAKRDEISRNWFYALENYTPVRKHKVKTINSIEYVANQDEIQNGLLMNMTYDKSISQSLINTNCSKVTLMIYNNIIKLANRFLPYNKYLKVRKYFQEKLGVNTKDELMRTFILGIYNMLMYLNKISSKSKLVIKKSNKEIEFFLENATYKENEILKNSVEEMISVVHNPRYVLNFGDIYLPVPHIISDKRENVDRFNKYLGNKAKVLYLRSEEGKRVLFSIKMLQTGLVESVSSRIYESTPQDMSESIVDVEVMKKYLKNN